MESGITESGESIAVSVVPAKCWTCGPSMVLSQLSPTSCLPCTMSSWWSSSSLAPGSDGSLKWQRNFTALLYVWSGSTSTTYSWPVASWQVVLPFCFFLLLCDSIYVCWEIIPMKQHIKYFWWKYLQRRLSRYLLVTPNWNPHQHEAGSILQSNVVSCPVNAHCWPAYEEYKKICAGV